MDGQALETVYLPCHRLHQHLFTAWKYGHLKACAYFDTDGDGCPFSRDQPLLRRLPDDRKFLSKSLSRMDGQALETV